MMELRLFLLVALASATWPSMSSLNTSSHQLVAVSDKPGSYVGVFRVNLRKEATFSFQLPETVTQALLCIQKANAELPDPNLYNAGTCLFFWYISESKTKNIQLRDIDYIWGIKVEGNGSFVFEGKGEICPSGQVWDEEICRDVDGSITEFNTTLSLAEVSYYTIVVPTIDPNLTTSFTIEIVPPIPGLEASLRYEGTPSEGHFDIEGLPATVQYPSAGNWFLRLEHEEEETNITVQFIFKRNICPSLKIGNTCSIEVVEGKKGFFVERVSLKKGQTTYYRWKDDSIPLWVSVNPFSRTLNPQEGNTSDLTVLARHGQIPFENQTDLINCNQEYCNHAKILKLKNKVESEFWYIAISPTGNDTEFSITFGSNCPSDCHNSTEQGVCGVEYQTGLCLCKYGWVGEDCNVVAGFNKAYAVLLIMGGIVLGAGLISLIVSCVTRPKSPEYQPL